MGDYVSLSQYRLIDIAGVDAEKYLQGQLTCDVAKLGVGSQTLTCHCDPKGKMSALMRLYRAETERFLALIRADLLPEALVQLKKYAVFSKVTFSEIDQPVWGILGLSGGENLPKNCFLLPENRAVCWGELPENAKPHAVWDLREIQLGEPILLKANQFELIPQATNLQALDQAISFTKGCYIGQETVARAKYRGANKRAMFVLKAENAAGENLPEIGSAIEMQLGENWRATGTILAAVQHNDELWFEVVMNKDQEPDTNYRWQNYALSLQPLPYGLEDA